MVSEGRVQRSPKKKNPDVSSCCSTCPALSHSFCLSSLSFSFPLCHSIWSLCSPFSFNSCFLASLLESHRAFLLALVPCRHRFPRQHLPCVSEDLQVPPLQNTARPGAASLWNLCPTPQGFAQSRDSASSRESPVFLWQFVSAGGFWKVLSESQSLFLELDSECVRRHKQASNRLQKVLLAFLTSGASHASIVTGNTQAWGPQAARRGEAAGCPHGGLHSGNPAGRFPGQTTARCLSLLSPGPLVAGCCRRRGGRAQQRRNAKDGGASVACFCVCDLSARCVLLVARRNAAEKPLPGP